MMWSGRRPPLAPSWRPGTPSPHPWHPLGPPSACPPADRKARRLVVAVASVACGLAPQAS
jgi:hypothetical protein